MRLYDVVFVYDDFGKEVSRTYRGDIGAIMIQFHKLATFNKPAKMLSNSRRVCRLVGKFMREITKTDENNFSIEKKRKRI